MEAKKPRTVKEINLECCHPGDTFRLKLCGNPFEKSVLITIEDPHVGTIQLHRESGLKMRARINSGFIEAEKSFVVKMGPADGRDGHTYLGYIHSIVRLNIVGR